MSDKNFDTGSTIQCKSNKLLAVVIRKGCVYDLIRSGRNIGGLAAIFWHVHEVI